MRLNDTRINYLPIHGAEMEKSAVLKPRCIEHQAVPHVWVIGPNAT